MPPPIPRCSSWAYSSLNSPSHFSLPRYGSRVGLHIVLFEACSTFTRVAACTLALSPIRDTLIEGFSHLKAPPLHGARHLRHFVDLEGMPTPIRRRSHLTRGTVQSCRGNTSVLHASAAPRSWNWRNSRPCPNPAPARS